MCNRVIIISRNENSVSISRYCNQNTGCGVLYREQHALDLFDGSEASEKGDDGDDDTRGDEDGGRADVQVRPQQPFHERLVGQRPHAHAEHRDAAYLEKQTNTSGSPMVLRNHLFLSICFVL